MPLSCLATVFWAVGVVDVDLVDVDFEGADFEGADFFAEILWVPALALAATPVRAFAEVVVDFLPAATLPEVIFREVCLPFRR